MPGCGHVVVELRPHTERGEVGATAGTHALICRRSKGVVGAWVVSGSGVGHVIIVRVSDHCFGDAATEVGHLRSDVAEESVARPSTNQHDGVNRNVVQIHGHGGGRPDRM